MDISVLLFGILPLLIFVVIDSISGVKAGVVSALMFGLLEIVYSLVVYDAIDNITIGSCLLLLLFGMLSLKTSNPIYLKLQPVVLGLVFAGVLFVMQLSGQPLMVLMAEKYQHMLPIQYRANLQNPAFLVMLARLSFVLGFGFFLHAALVAYAAFFMNKWWWLALRGVGLYVVLISCVVIVRFTA